MPTTRTPTERRQHTLRIISVVAATAIALSCGTNYAYSAWSPQFAARLNLTATQQNLIGNAGNIGMYAMGLPGGLLIDTRGPRWGVLIGCIALAVGYFSLRGAYILGPGGVGVGWLCLYGLLTGVGSATGFTASLKVCALNWPRHRGTATAFPLSAFGLSAFFWTTAAAVVFPDDTAGYLLLLACGTSVLVFVGMVFLQIVRPPAEGDGRPGGGVRRDSSRLRRSRLLPNNDPDREDADPEQQEATESSSLVSSSPGDLDDDDLKHHTPTPVHPNITGWRLLRTPRFWHLFILLSLLCGVGLMTINNIGNNALILWHHYSPSASKDFIQHRQLLHVATLSLAQFFGRLASGIGSDWLVHHHSSRFWTLVASACIFSAAQVSALLIGNPNNLFWLSGLTGLAYGALFGVYPALVADAFGPAGMGINWGAMTMAPVLSGNFFNLAYGRILDQHSRVGEAGDRVCEEGRECYGGAYWITLVASAVGVGWCGWCILMERREKRRERERVEGVGRGHEG